MFFEINDIQIKHVAIVLLHLEARRRVPIQLKQSRFVARIFTRSLSIPVSLSSTLLSIPLTRYNNNDNKNFILYCKIPSVVITSGINSMNRKYTINDLKLYNTMIKMRAQHITFSKAIKAISVRF